MRSYYIWPALRFLFGTFVFVYFAYLAYHYYLVKPQNNTIVNVATIITKIETIGKLELCKFEMQQIVEHTLERGTFMPNARLILIVVGEAVGCIDLQKIRPNDIRVSDSAVFVKLPPAQICYFRIDHQRSKVYDTDFELLDGSTLTQNAYKQAETQIYASAIDGGILKQTDENAQKVLRPLLEQVSGGKKIIFEYRLERLD